MNSNFISIYDVIININNIVSVNFLDDTSGIRIQLSCTNEKEDYLRFLTDTDEEAEKLLKAITDKLVPEENRFQYEG